MEILAALAGFMPVISRILENVIPDPEARERIKLEVMKLASERDGELYKAIAEVAKAQSAVNATEAQSASTFVAGWRPFVGWVCGVGCAYTFIGQPVIAWATGILGTALGVSFPVPPIPDSQVLFGLLTGMLGFAGLRTFEKTQGVADSSVTLGTK